MGTQYTEVYRLKYIDAEFRRGSISAVISKSYLAVDADLNAITVTSNLTVQRRIADAVSQLDLPPPGSPGGRRTVGRRHPALKSLNCRAAVPGPQGGLRRPPRTSQAPSPKHCRAPLAICTSSFRPIRPNSC